LDLRPENDKELEEMFLILKDILPKITKLKLTSLKLTGLPEGYTFPILQYAEFNCSSLQKIGDMPALQEIYFHDCLYLDEVGIMPMLQKWYFGLSRSLSGERMLGAFYESQETSKDLLDCLKRIRRRQLSIRALRYYP
jgi:hypothetical protein